MNSLQQLSTVCKTAFCPLLYASTIPYWKVRLAGLVSFTFRRMFLRESHHVKNSSPTLLKLLHMPRLLRLNKSEEYLANAADYVVKSKMPTGLGENRPSIHAPQCRNGTA